MIVKFLLSQTDQDAQQMVVRFKNEGIASLTTKDLHFGFIRRVGEEKNKIMIIADVTEPELLAWIKEKVGEGEPIEFEPERGDSI